MKKYSNMTTINEYGKSDCLCDKAYYHCYDKIYPDILEKYLNKKDLRFK